VSISCFLAEDEVLTVYRFFGPLVEEQMKAAASEVVISEIFENCGHSLSLEQPERLANLLSKFIL
jgi:pimeloyl-ACP methyl ester carboxylesterase